jgi:hypothetical protein
MVQTRGFIPVLTLLVLAALVLLFGATTLPVLANGGRPLSATLTGAAERPGPGDPDGSGTANLTLNQGQGEVCFDITVANIGTITGAHIHVAPVGEPGPIVVDFDPATNGLRNCVSGVDKALIKQIRQNPSGYYVNVHTTEFRPGAIRGQLSK